MGRGDRDYDNGSSSRRRDSKLSSTVEVPHRRHSTDRDSRRGSPRQGRRRTPSPSPPPSYSSDDHHRRNYSPVNNHRSRSHYEPDRRHKESHSNEFSNPRRSPRYDRPNESRSNEFSNPRRSPRYDRHNESRSNEFSNPRRSPGYDRHNESRSDEFLNPRRSPRYDRYERNDQYERNDRVNRAVPFLDREFKNGKVAESDSDEELKGLPYEEFRRLKRQKLRKRLRNCIWRITPSPPRSEWDEDRLEPPVEDFVDNEEKGSLGDEDRKERVDLDGSESSLSGTSSESESESEKDDSRSRRKRGSGRKGRRKSKSSRSRRRIKSKSESDSGSESGSESSELETKGSKKSTSKRARRGKRSKRRSKKIRKRSSDIASDESESEKSVSDKSDAEGSSDDNARSKKRKGSTLDSQSIKGKKKKHSGSVSENSDKSLSGSDIEGKTVGTVDELMKAEMNSEALAFKELLDLQKKAGLEAEDVVGPMPLPRAEGHISYGGALRPGEGDAIAQYVQQGKRIPRRGEVGLSADEIQRFEDLGYVMSGSRHQRMNAIRIRKENQVYSAEDKRALAMFNYEEKAKREHKVMADLQRLVQRHIGEDVGPTHDPFGGKATDDADT